MEADARERAEEARRSMEEAARVAEEADRLLEETTVKLEVALPLVLRLKGNMDEIRAQMQGMFDSVVESARGALGKFFGRKKKTEGEETKAVLEAAAAEAERQRLLHEAMMAAAADEDEKARLMALEEQRLLDAEEELTRLAAEQTRKDAEQAVWDALNAVQEDYVEAVTLAESADVPKRTLTEMVEGNLFEMYARMRKEQEKAKGLHLK